MAFCIIRVAKLGGKGKVAASAAHLSRERECKNADPDLKRENEVYSGAKSTAGVMQRLDRRLATVDRKVRSDAVLALEYVITYSPGAFQDKKTSRAYFNNAIAWLEAKHGVNNVLMAVEHRDETTPHLHVLVTPIHTKTNKKGKEVTALCAKDYCDGSKKLSALQDDFHHHVAVHFGLERGVRGSVARHERVKSFYGTLEREDPAPALRPPKKRLFEPQKAYQARATESVREQAQGWAVGIQQVEAKKAARELAADRQKVEIERNRALSAVRGAEQTHKDAQLERERALQLRDEAKRLRDESTFKEEIRMSNMKIRELLEENRKYEVRLEREKAAKEATEKRLKEFQNFIEKATPADLQATQQRWRQEDERSRGHSR